MRKSTRVQRPAYLGLIAAVAAIALLVYQIEPSGSPLRPLAWNVMLLPIVLASYYVGIKAGFWMSAAALGALTPVLLPAFIAYGISPATMAHCATLVLLFAMPVLVDNISSQQRREANLSSAVVRLGNLLEERLTADRLLPAFVRDVTEHYGADCAALYCRDSRSGAFELDAFYRSQKKGHQSFGDRASFEQPEMRAWAEGCASALLATTRADLPSPLRGENSGGNAPGSCVAIPLNGSQGTFALLVMLAKSQGAFDRLTLNSLTSLPEEVLQALEQALLHREVERTAGELVTLNEIAAAISASLDLGGTVKSVITSLQRAFPDYAIELLQFDDQSKSLRLVGRATTQGIESEGLGASENRAASATIDAANLMDDEKLGERGISLPIQLGTGEWFEHTIQIPLYVGTRPIGVLALYSNSVESFGLREREVLKVAAAQISVAMNNASQYERTDRELARRLTEIAALQGLAKEFNATLDLPKVLKVVLEGCLTVTSADLGFIALWDEMTQEFDHEISLTASGQPVDRRALTCARAALRKTVKSGTPTVSVVTESLEEASEVRSKLCTAILRAGQVVGGLYLEANRHESFSAADVRIVSHLSDHAATALDNARLFNEATERARELALLLDASELVSSSLDLDKILNVLAKKLVSALHVSFCHISLLDDPRQRLTVRASAAASLRAGLIPVSHVIDLDQARRCRSVVQRGHHLLVHQDDPETALDSNELSLTAGPRARSILLAPLTIKGNVLGLITVGEHRAWERAPLNPRKISLCQALAAEAAIAIENAQLFNVVREEERRTRRIVQGIADGVITTDRERRILTFNPAAERITGWKAQEVVGQFCCDIMRPGDGKVSSQCAGSSCSSECPMLVPLTRGEEAQVGPVVWRASGRSSSPLQVACSAAPLGGADGEIVGVVAIFRDVTREAELDQLKSDFVSMVSHEIRAPLASISAAAQVLHSSQDPTSATELLDLIDSQSMRLSSFVEEVLNANRLEQGRIELRLEPMPVLPLLRRAVTEAQKTTVLHHLALHSHVAMPFVMGDSKAIELIINNLLRNAINYAPDGGDIRVEVEEQANEVLVSVRDEGIGIPANHIERIFERFARVDDRDAKTVYGYGLGLYIARGFVERQGGRIWVESSVGQGARFTFSLPKFQCLPEAEGEGLSLVNAE